MLILTDSHSRQADTMAREMGVWGFNPKMLAGWMKSMTSRQQWVIETFQYQHPRLKVGKQRKVLGLVSYNN